MSPTDILAALIGIAAAAFAVIAMVFDRPRRRDPAKTTRMPMFLPVIFANGEDDDSHGLAAWFRQESAVVYGDQLYKPGDHLVIDGQRLVFKRGLRLVDQSSGECMLQMGGSVGAITVPVDVVPEGEQTSISHTVISSCQIDLQNGIFWKAPNFVLG